MDQQQQSRWQPTRRQLLWAGGIAALAFLIIVICGYLFGWKWTGLPKRTLWDWLSLLIVPSVLAIGGYLLTERQRTLDRQIATNRTLADREIADQRRQDDTLQAYLDHIGELLLDKDRPLGPSEEDDKVATLARARTLTVLRRLDGERKGRVLQFLYEAGLIAKDHTVLYLIGADLSNAPLREANLRETNLRETDLREADLSDVILSGAILNQTNLSGADLSGAILSGADLGYANLSGANLSHTNLSEVNLNAADLNAADLSHAILSSADLIEVDLSGADLSGADLSGADLSGAKRVANEQLSAATSLEGAIMPDGQPLKTADYPGDPTLEDWLKDKKAQGKDEKNE